MCRGHVQLRGRERGEGEGGGSLLASVGGLMSAQVNSDKRHLQRPFLAMAELRAFGYCCLKEEE